MISKFKVWDLECKFFIPVTEFYAHNGVLWVSPVGGDVRKAENKLVIVPYIEQTDKNGVDVYDGWILTGKDYTGFIELDTNGFRFDNGLSINLRDINFNELD